VEGTKFAAVISGIFPRKCSRCFFFTTHFLQALLSHRALSIKKAQRPLRLLLQRCTFSFQLDTLSTQVQPRDDRCGIILLSLN
jgi:hypothetical protein